MATLITGGAGYIGSHTIVEMLNDNRDVVVMDNFSNSKPAVLDRIREISGKDFRFYEVDMLDKQAMERIFQENKIDSCIHFAGFKAVGESVKHPLMYYHNNIIGTINLCELLSEYNAKKIVFSSSATVYGKPKSVPIKEDFPLSTENPYGETKLMIERILSDLYKSDNEWSITILRYFNPVGAHISGRMGEDPRGIPNNLMPYISQVAQGRLSHLNVFGDDYKTHDGTGVRDYIHVVDLANAHLHALDYTLKNNVIEHFNIGTGVGYSVLDMINAYQRVTAKKIPYKITARRPGDVDECYADPERANRVLGWNAERGLDEMCADADRWQTNNPMGYDK